MKQEDKRILDGIIGNLEYLLSIEDCDELAHNLRNRISWVKTLKDRVVLQSKQEWNDEDETGLHDAYSIVSDFNNSIPEEPVIEDILDMSKIDYKIQYASVESGIHAYAETYSFNIESQLFNQLTKEQQGLWRKEIEQAVINGGHWGVDLAKDKRYKENQEPVEWSEKDEEIRTALIKYLGSSDSLSVDLASAICWLKSLRPQSTWKPNNEQIEALKACVGKTWFDRDTLRELLEQLKKLREELL